MYPISKTVTGTGTFFLTAPDIAQNPFNIGFGVQLVTGGLTTAILSVEHTFDYSTVMAPTFNGLTGLVGGAVSTAAWFPNSSFNVVTVTATIGTANVTAAGNYAYAVAGIRLNVISATATSIVVINLIQSVNAP